jgi:hypothetical protein
MTRFAWLVAFALTSGCSYLKAKPPMTQAPSKPAAAAPEYIKMVSQFNEVEAKRLLRRGKNSIRGNAFLRQTGGGVVTCAGEKVFLVPSTEYTRERMTYDYSDATEGYHPTPKLLSWEAYQAVKIPHEPKENSKYVKSMRETTCDARGDFEFNNVADGEFFVTTNVSWKVAGEEQGGGLMKRVSVAGGETSAMVISQPSRGTSSSITIQKKPSNLPESDAVKPTPSNGETKGGGVLDRVLGW